MVAQGMEATEAMGAIHMAAQGITTAARDMEVMGTMVTAMVAGIIITDGLMITTSTPILAPETSLFGVDQVFFGSGRLGSRHFGLVVFGGDLALVSHSCRSGKLRDGMLQVLPLVTFCLTRLFQPSRFLWL